MSRGILIKASSSSALTRKINQMKHYNLLFIVLKSRGSVIVTQQKAEKGSHILPTHQDSVHTGCSHVLCRFTPNNETSWRLLMNTAVVYLMSIVDKTVVRLFLCM